MRKVLEIGEELGIAPTCTAIGLSRATCNRHRHPTAEPRERRPPARKLSEEECHRVLDVLHEPRFVDRAPNQITVPGTFLLLPCKWRNVPGTVLRSTQA